MLLIKTCSLYNISSSFRFRVKGKRDLAEGANGKAPEAYPHPIYNNVLPHIDVFLEDGYTKEEQK